MGVGISFFCSSGGGEKTQFPPILEDDPSLRSLKSHAQPSPSVQLAVVGMGAWENWNGEGYFCRKIAFFPLTKEKALFSRLALALLRSIGRRE